MGYPSTLWHYLVPPKAKVQPPLTAVLLIIHLRLFLYMYKYMKDNTLGDTKGNLKESAVR